MEELKISVIIPVYGVKAYLKDCVDSVLNQTYSNLEIILVDDGSPDECPILCDQYAEQFYNIKVIHKKNGGLSDARNVGAAQAAGDYVLFLDGDDYWDDPEAVSKLAARAIETGTEVLNFSYQKVQEETGEKVPYFRNIPAMPTELRQKEKQLRYLLDGGLYIASACNKLIRRELAVSLPFERGVYSEDVEWCARLLQKARSMDFICANFYCYRQRSGSISKSINEKKCMDLSKHILECIRLAEQADGNEQEALRRYAAYQYGTFFKVQAFAETAPTESIKALAPYRRILSSHGGNSKLRCLRLGTGLLGYENFCKLLRLLYCRQR